MALDADRLWISEYLYAQDRIMREIVKLVVGLGESSKAWDKDFSTASLNTLADELERFAENAGDDKTRRIVLLGFAGFARELPLRNQLASSPPGTMQ